MPPSIPPRPPFDPVGILTQNLTRLVAAIQLCAGHQLITPTLILLYCGIDMAGWLVPPPVPPKDALAAPAEAITRLTPPPTQSLVRSSGPRRSTGRSATSSAPC
jgi:hypothetical protein